MEELKRILEEERAREAEKIADELEGLTLYQLKEFRAKTENAFRNYSPTKEGHDLKNAYIKYEKFFEAFRQINKAISEKTQTTVEILTEQAKNALEKALSDLDYLTTIQIEATENRRATENKARQICNLLNILKELNN